MARSSSNPMQEHHRKTRSKEMQKNKQRRTKERDDVVLKTKTIPDVREEIQTAEREMKRHAGSQQQRGSSERKVARLQKELKILQEAAATKAKAEAADPESAMEQQQQQNEQRPLTELDDPRKSVYYDKIMNPYGAPPPGKPRLYHRRWGGLTSNPHEAVVPGEEVPPPPPLPPPLSTTHQSNNNNRFGQELTSNNSQLRYHHSGGHHQNNQRTNYHQQQGQSQSSCYPSRRQQQHLNIPPPNQQKNNESTDDETTIIKKGNEKSSLESKDDDSLLLPPTRETKNSDNSQKDGNKINVKINCNTNTNKSNKIAAAATKTTKSETETETSLNVPSLPTPSKAVQRATRVRNKRYGNNRNNSKNGIAADIWASTEEVEYERKTNLVDLEADDFGTSKAKSKKKKKKKLPLEFYYRDTSDLPQGPFTKSQVNDWSEAGYFPPTTMARTNRMKEDKWMLMSDLPALQDNNNTTTTTSRETKTNDNVQDRIAFLKRDQQRDDEVVDNKNNDDDDEGIDILMQDRIAALKADLASSNPKQQHTDDDDKGVDSNGRPEPENESTQNRVASLTEDTKVVDKHNTITNSEGQPSDKVQDRIAALRGDKKFIDKPETTVNSEREQPPPPPPPLPSSVHPVNNDADNVGPAYPVDTDNGTVAYPVDNNVGVAMYPAYPVDDEDSAASYLVSDYPVDGDVDDEDAVTPYPTGESYPGAEDLSYPVTDSYPIENCNNVVSAHEDKSHDISSVYPLPEDDIVTEPKKVVKVNKELVTFIPSNIRNKKRKANVEPDKLEVISFEDTKHKKIKSTTSKRLGGETTDEDYDKFMQEIDEL